ncbi:MAG: M24 family metallopeptidase [Alphaproteobacteria bacterium]|jgi:ectoine hydrolase|nr:M24 family metallopeptidase [Alphaproteobacteria bacterium]
MPADIELPFRPEEYGRRLEKVRHVMATRGLDVLVVSDPSNMAWLTGYDGWSFYVHQAVVVFLDADPWWWGRGQDAAGARRTVWMGEDRIRAYPDGYVQSRERHPMQHLAAELVDDGRARARLGVELDNYWYSAAADRALRAALPEARFDDATALVNWQRAVKSETELTYMRRAARIVERMHDVVRAEMRPGVRKCDLVAKLTAAGIEGADGHGGDYPAIVPLLPTGRAAAAPHLTWDDEPFEPGAATFFEIAGCHRRYHAPLCRTVHLGPPPRFLRDAERALFDGLEAGLEAARAGNRACDVAAALHTVLAAAGIHRDARCGYAVGLSYPPDWGERTISFRAEDDTVLEPNMTFHFMPGLWMEDWGLEITESIVIRERGPAECLADYPRELVVIE